MIICTIKDFIRTIPFTGIVMMILFTCNLNAQTVDIPSHQEFKSMYSGTHQGTGRTETVVAFSGILTVSPSPWLRLQFNSANLGDASYVIIRSVQDDKWQRLDQVSIEQWEYSSAYFNGNSLEIELHVAPLDKEIYFNIDQQIVGDWVDGSFPIESQCGPTDDRIHSDQPATGRLMNIGCTAWIIPNGHFVSAGHCVSGSGANVVQFQVPPSLPNGTVQHPGPEDQYAVISGSIVGTNGGVGNDWGTFEVSPNSVTGLMPKVAQGAFWPLRQDFGPDSIRITGYGVDTGVDNQVQQTHVGPNAGSSGTTMRYVTDTEGGNSGSPVIDPATGFAVGVHTHGGCNTSGTGNNNGTSLFHTAFWDAVEQGAGGCVVEPSSNPDPAHASTDVSINLTEITWDNGAGATQIEVFFGEAGNMTSVYDGALITTWSVPGPLEYGTTYQWQVDGRNDTCTTFGPLWTFTTEGDPNIIVDALFFDDFESGDGNWAITTVGGCPWAIVNIGANGYTLPPTATGNVMTADADLCGSGGGGSSGDITLVTPIDASLYQTVWIEFDNDWQAIDIDDFAMLDVSVDGGTSWQNVFTFDVTDIRNTHENWDISSIAANSSSLLVRLVSVQPGWDWWWTVDNFAIYGSYVVPVELTSFAAVVSGNNVKLNWSTATETNNQGFEVQRRSNNNDYEKISFIAGHGTTTESKSYAFSDIDMAPGNYTYRMKQIDFDGGYEYSNEIEVIISAPKDFALQQNYPNPFNPETKIEFSLKTDSKISLVVFDILGQEVAKLISGNLNAGVHQINFDASTLNSGVYLYRIDATGIDGSSFTSVRKMILTK